MGLPWTAPAAVAVRVFWPVARIQLPTVALPDASVICVEPVRLPAPAVMAKVTVTPEAGFPSPSRTSTEGLGDTELPATPDRLVGEFAEINPAVSPSRKAVMSSIMLVVIEIPPMAMPAGELLNAGDV